MTASQTLAAAPESLPRSDRSGAAICNLRRQAIVLGIMLAAMLAMYSSALILNYAYADDYGLLDQALPPYPPGHVFKGDATQGRWLLGLILQYAYAHAHKIENVRAMRLATIVGMAVVAWAVHLHLRRAGWSLLTSVCVPILLCSLPPIQVYIVWASWMPNPIGMLLTVIAALIATDVLDGRISRWFTLLAGLLLVLAMTFYQPAEMIFVALILIDIFAPTRRSAPLLDICKRLGLFAALEGIGLFGGYLAIKAGIYFFPGYVMAGRTGFSDLSGKPRWFVQVPLTYSLNLWNLNASYTMAITMGSIITVGLLLYFGGTWRRVACLLLCAISLPGAHLPNLLSGAEGAYRTQAGISWSVFILLILALAGIWQTIVRVAALARKTSGKRAIVDPLPRAALVVIAGFGVCAAAYLSTAYITWPSALELAVLRMQMTRPDVKRARHLIFLQMRGPDDFPVHAYEEFGCPSIAYVYPWAPVGAVYMIDRETNKHAARRDVRVIQYFNGPWTDPLPRNVAVIDMRGLGANRVQ